VLRVTVVVGVAALVVPGLIQTWQLQERTATAACRIVQGVLDDTATGSEVRFEAVGANGPSWYCYSRDFDGTERPLRALGLIPGLEPGWRTH
jgi:hypothetical protein